MWFNKAIGFPTFLKRGEKNSTAESQRFMRATSLRNGSSKSSLTNLMTTSRPSWRVAAWTCPMLAAAMGSSSIEAKWSANPSGQFFVISRESGAACLVWVRW